MVSLPLPSVNQRQTHPYLICAWYLNSLPGHLTQSQKAAIAIDLLSHLEAEAKERHGTRTDISPQVGESPKQGVFLLDFCLRILTERHSFMDFR